MQVPEAVEETDGFGRTNNVARHEKKRSRVVKKGGKGGESEWM